MVLPTGHFLHSTAWIKRDVWLRAYEQWCSCHCSAQPGPRCPCWWEKTKLQAHDSKRIPSMASVPFSLSQLWPPSSCKNPYLPWSTNQSCKILETALSYLLPSSHCQVLRSAQELPGWQHWFTLAILLFTRYRYEKQIWDPINPPVNSAAAKSTP